MKHILILFLLMNLSIFFGTGTMTMSRADQTNSGNKADYEIIYWESVKDSNNIDMFRAYLKTYPNGFFSDLAKIKIKMLQEEAQKPAVSTAASGNKKNNRISTQTALPLLRDTPIRIEEAEIRKMVIKHNFRDWQRNYDGDFKNDFKDNHDGTLTDQTSGLIWEKNGSWRRQSRKKADAYIAELNRKKFAGRSDWRLPTVEELASLIEKEPLSYYQFYIHPMFDKTEKRNWLDRCWTSDTLRMPQGADEAAWIVDFKNCGISTAYWYHRTIGSLHPKNEYNYVRAVCSVKP